MGALRWLSAFCGARLEAIRSEFDPPLWLVGHVAWFQECAIARNLRRAQGRDAAGTTMLASIEPRADGWFDPSTSTREQRWRDTDVSDAHLRDYLAATLDALPEVAEAVAGRAEVYLDGGIRRGADVAKALALGARAVLAGRAPVFGLAAAGEDGVRHVLELLRDELTLTLTRK